MDRAIPLPLVLIVVAAGVLAVLLFTGKISGLGAAKTGNASGLDPDRLPLTLVDVQKAGGFESLSAKQKGWVRWRYLNDLTKLLRVADYRLRIAKLRGQAKAARDLENIRNLLTEALARLEDDSSDPTAEQTLLNDVIAALKR